ncbi:unnamed protein product [Miscanthus lutarioriparius]|uniref:Uncharacterized protein n=1 Tax=Miscanthus lutarioriparius TaxID=422564 RepID=A0A811R7P1_9POAL|nr:unnamed protein product [Miscanthus lutarioriparius]
MATGRHNAVGGPRRASQGPGDPRRGSPGTDWPARDGLGSRRSLLVCKSSVEVPVTGIIIILPSQMGQTSKDESMWLWTISNGLDSKGAPLLVFLSCIRYLKSDSALIAFGTPYLFAIGIYLRYSTLFSLVYIYSDTIYGGIDGVTL